MSRPRTAAALRAVVASVILLLTSSVAPLSVASGTARAAEEDEATPLTVELTELSPSTIPATGNVVLAGSVRNDSEETWAAINVHPFIGESPMTTREQLAFAAQVDAEADVGGRLTDPGQFNAIGDLVPGQTVPFRISIQVEDLPISGAAGVYWIGVHARGQGTDGSRSVLGRARTFIPLVDGARSTSVSLVVPVRERVRRSPDARLMDTSSWSETLAGDGRLRRIVDFLGSAGSDDVSLLVDPAVLEAVESVAAGNPPISLGKADEEESPSPTPTEGTSRSANRLDAEDSANAASWLRALAVLVSARTVLGLGYGDPDTPALARNQAALLGVADRVAMQTFDRLDIASIPTIAPPDGWLDDDALEKIPADSLVLVSDHSAPRTRTHWRTRTDQDLVFADAQASSGGPGPTPRLDALALRQRIVADAALRAGEGATEPMVVELPPSWDPGSSWRSADFFEALRLPWLNLVPLTRSGDPRTPTFDAALGYPAAERSAEVDLRNLGAASQLIRTANVTSQLLRTANQVWHVLAGTAFTAVSYQAREDPDTARAAVLATNARMRSRLNGVEVIGPDFVTLSGGRGTLAITLVNRLEQPITVGITPRTGSSGVRIETPEPVEMAPGERAVFRLEAKASSIGVHQVTLAPVTRTGAEVGMPLTFSLRTSEVGTLIWFVLAGAAGLLVVMIGRRILRGVREHRWRGQ